MNSIKTITAAAALFGFASFSSAAQAQTALTNGVTFESGALSGSYTTMNLGSNAGTGMSSMPLSLSYANVNVGIMFTGGGGLSYSETQWNPTPGQNFLTVPGTATLQFSSAQSFFGAMWSSPDNANMLSFYNGSQLLASMSGTQFRSASGAGNRSAGTQAAFNFSELSYDKVVITGGPGAFVEVGGITSPTRPSTSPPSPSTPQALAG